MSNDWWKNLENAFGVNASDLQKMVDEYNQLNELIEEQNQLNGLVNQDLLIQKREYDEASETQKILIDQEKELADIREKANQELAIAESKHNAEIQKLQDIKSLYEVFQGYE
ncbi:MAG: hypothetical protein LBQ24_02695 [Candidatus Peribacteria bacterium]|jgi:hypothetical protein|nr:hypothetical protein [Candidatus Peribacteria bacterium]